MRGPARRRMCPLSLIAVGKVAVLAAPPRSCIFPPLHTNACEAPLRVPRPLSPITQPRALIAVAEARFPPSVPRSRRIQPPSANPRSSRRPPTAAAAAAILTTATTIEIVVRRTVFTALSDTPKDGDNKRGGDRTLPV